MEWQSKAGFFVSWHITGEGTSSDHVAKHLENKIPEHSAEGVQEQIEYAIQIVESLIGTGWYGDGPYKAVLSGHAKQGDSDIHGNSLSISIHSQS
jgi:hypothetical protein